MKDHAVDPLRNYPLHGYNPGALQELVIICIYEELVKMEFAPPQELPISTTRAHVI